eukprot:9498539-Pyramimonas_sp.AAC.1
MAHMCAHAQAARDSAAQVHQGLLTDGGETRWTCGFTTATATTAAAALGHICLRGLGCPAN